MLRGDLACLGEPGLSGWRKAESVAAAVGRGTSAFHDALLFEFVDRADQATGFQRKTLRKLLLGRALVEVDEVEQRKVLGPEIERLQVFAETRDLASPYLAEQVGGGNRERWPTTDLVM